MQDRAHRDLERQLGQAARAAAAAVARRAPARRRLPAGDQARRRRVHRAARRRARRARLRGRRPRRGRPGTAWRSSRASGSRTSCAGLPGGPGFPHQEARAVSATCGGVRVVSVYVPNGRAPDSDHYRYKLAVAGRAARRWSPPAPDATLVCGDVNIAPDRRGRLRPRRLRRPDPRHARPSARRWPSCRRVGLHDVVRDRWPDERVFTYWDYRAGMFHQDLGMRIDLVLAAAPVAERVTGGVGRPPGAQGQGPERPRPGDRRPRRGARRGHRAGRAAAVGAGHRGAARRSCRRRRSGRRTSAGRVSRDGCTRLGSPGIFG